MQMPSPFIQKGPDRLQVRGGGGCLSIFGLPFLAAGIFMTLMGLGIVPVRSTGNQPGLWVLLLMGSVFVVVGGGLVFGRQWITLDRARGTILKQWGLLFPLRGETLNPEDFTSVVLKYEPGDSDSSERYPVCLKSRFDKDVQIHTSTDYGFSREQAALAAGFLGFPLRDVTTRHATVLSPDQIGASLQERVSLGAEGHESAPRPFVMQSDVQESGAEVRIKIPGPGFRPAMLLQFAIPAGIALYFGPQLAVFFDRTHTPRPVQFAFLGFAAFLLGFLPLMGLLGSIMKAIRARTTIVATPESITIVEQGAWRARSTIILASDIVDLDYGGAKPFPVPRMKTGSDPAFETPEVPPRWVSVLNRLASSKGVTVKTRRGLFAVGAGLPDEEAAYLHTVLLRALSAGGPVLRQGSRRA
ncbi:MAG: hypothetical protein ACLGPL_11475 [Acidobacteriota bacterium]